MNVDRSDIHSQALCSLIGIYLDIGRFSNRLAERDGNSQFYHCSRMIPRLRRQMSSLHITANKVARHCTDTSTVINIKH